MNVRWQYKIGEIGTKYSPMRRKTEFGVIHLTDGEGDTVRILGSMFDNALHMDENIKKMVGKARPKITALLRCRRFYDRANMINQYKTHVLFLLEGNPGAHYHACDTVLGPLERIQTSFLKQMDMDTGFAFLGYNLAPLSTRRDIAMLGFIYKAVHGQAHSDIRKLFPRSDLVSHSYETKFQAHRNSLQLLEFRPGTQHALLRRSLFGLTRVWNRLPEQVVQATTVTSMQKMLTAMVRAACSQNQKDWAETFSPRSALLRESPHFEQLLYKSVKCDGQWYK